MFYFVYVGPRGFVVVVVVVKGPSQYFPLAVHLVALRQKNMFHITEQGEGKLDSSPCGAKRIVLVFYSSQPGGFNLI